MYRTSIVLSMLLLSGCGSDTPDGTLSKVSSSSTQSNSSSQNSLASSEKSSVTVAKSSAPSSSIAMSSVKSSSSEAAVYETSQVFTDTKSDTVYNSRGVYVTSQCYTKTEDANGVIHNPCFTCHINSHEPNYIDDWDLQESYAFGEITKINPFTNLFKDRTKLVEAISDTAILEYVRQDNYFDADQKIMLAEILKRVPSQWDRNNDGHWSGYMPDCYFNFDNEGFDVDPHGNHTGWRAFGYYPFLGTFWPTNGSTDDVLIRLPHSMRQNKNGQFDPHVYKVNLAIVEALIKQSDIVIEPTDETDHGVDLNQNGVLDTATTIVYKWIAPQYDFVNKIFKNYSMYYVGQANAAQIAGDLHMAPGLYPEGTEFLHTVRYIDVHEDGSIGMAKRMKELRYGIKTGWNTYAQLSNASKAEIKEKEAFPERLRTIDGNSEFGLHTGLGWVYQGFIEDKQGYLRPQTYEETLFCIGCHSGIGAIVDSTFVFARKFDHTEKQMGWYHWTQKENAFNNLKEPKLADGRYEFSLYLEQNHAGDEFRDNTEVMEKFFDANGSLKQDEINRLHTDLSHLIVPTAKRALTLNKAYKVIVEEQSFAFGRDAHVQPVTNVHQEVEADQETGIKALKMERYPLR